MDVSRRSRIVLITIVLQLSACTAQSADPGRLAHSQTTHHKMRAVPLTNGAPVCFQRTRNIVWDLISAMAQLPALNPATTTLNLPRSHSRFDTLLLEGVQELGYAVRQQHNAEGAHEGIMLGHSVRADAPVDPRDDTVQGVYFFTLTAGDVGLRRAYRVSVSGVQPASSLFVRGADASAVVLDEAVFSAHPSC